MIFGSVRCYACNVCVLPEVAVDAVSVTVLSQDGDYTSGDEGYVTRLHGTLHICGILAPPIPIWSMVHCCILSNW